MKKKILLLSVILLTSCLNNNDFSSEKNSSLFSSEENLSDDSFFSEEDSLANSDYESVLSEENSTNNTIQEIEDYIKYMMDETEEYIPSWSKEGFKGRWNYIDGVMLTSLLNMYEATNEDRYKDFVVNFTNYYIDKNGKFINYLDQSSSGYKDNFELDTICESRILYPLYELTSDERYLIGIETTYNQILNQPRTIEGNFFHKEIYENQVWLDGLYMVMPFYTMYANNNIDAKVDVNEHTISLYEDIYNQYKNVRSKMFDEEKGLYYHGYDVSKKQDWANSETGCSPSFWLRSIGWYMVSLIDVIELLEDGVMKEYLSDLLIELVDGLMKYQDESKMFYQVVDKKGEGIEVPGKYFSDGKSRYVNNYLETSGSSMIAYTLLKGARLNVLDNEYNHKGKEIFFAIKDKYFRIENGEYFLDNICITAGLGGNRDGSFAYYLSEDVGCNDAKGVGPFIMAYSELIK